ncbi:MAG: RNA-binding protein [Candidatus Kapaibacterium sp.]
MKIYVGNISRESSEEEVKELFTKYGTVENFKLIRDVSTGMIKGYGFVDMINEDEGQKAIDELNGSDFKDRPLTVSLANPNAADKKKKPFTKGKSGGFQPKSPGGFNKGGGYKSGGFKSGGYKSGGSFDKGPKKPNPDGGNVNGNREGGNDIGGFHYNNY